MLYRDSRARSPYHAAPWPGSHTLPRAACADRKSGGVRVAPTSEFEATVGPPALRRSCGIAAVVGLLSYYDDHSLVIVMEATPRHAICDRGPMPVHAIAKTAFIPLKPPPGTESWQVPRLSPMGFEEAAGERSHAERAAEKAAEERAVESASGVATKQRAQLKELLEAGDVF